MSIPGFLNIDDYNKIIKGEYSKTSVQYKKLIVDFNNGGRYEYEDIPHQTYTKFRMSQSQGKFFMSEIAKKYIYKKL